LNRQFRQVAIVLSHGGHDRQGRQAGKLGGTASKSASKLVNLGTGRKVGETLKQWKCQNFRGY